MAADAFSRQLDRLLPQGREWQDRHVATWDPRDGTTPWFSSSLAVGAHWLPNPGVAVPRLVLVWLLRGRASFRLPDGSWSEVPAGGGFVRFPGVVHAVRIETAAQPAFWSLTLPPGAAQILAGDDLSPARPLVGPVRDADLLRRAGELHQRVARREDAVASQLAALALATDILGFRREMTPEEALAARLAGAGGDAAVMAVAAELHLSPSRLRHRFTMRYGLPPERWRRRERLRLAHRLMAGGDLTADAVARRCGWRGSRAMAKAFRAAFGYPPSACRLED